jgi:hypothetical protein
MHSQRGCLFGLQLTRMLSWHSMSNLEKVLNTLSELSGLVRHYLMGLIAYQKWWDYKLLFMRLSILLLMQVHSL